MRRKEREITDIADIESIIIRADVCRIALADNNTPYIITMNFGYKGGDDKKLFFHCAQAGRKIDMIKKNNYVCFEIDTDHALAKGDAACDFSMKYSSVVGWGNIFVVDNDNEKTEGLDSIMNHYTDRSFYAYYPDVLKRTTVLRLDIVSMTGKRIQ